VRTAFEIRSGRIAALDSALRHGTLADADHPAVLMIPGYTGSKEDFLPLFRPLHEAGYRAVAIDQRGQYESEWAESSSGYTIDALGADVCDIARLVRRDGFALHLVGHSFGGLVGRSAVLSERALFDSYTLMCSGPAAIDGSRRQDIIANEPVLAHQGMGAVWARIEARSQTDPKFRQAPPALLAFLQTRFLANDPDGLTIMGNQIINAQDRTDDLAAAGVRLLVLHGIADDAWPPAVQAEMAARLDAQHVIIEQAAHSPAVENPADTARALIEFFDATR